MISANISKLYAISFFKMFLVLMPIIVPFFESFGKGMEGVYVLQSIFAITVFFLEIPSGYISDVLGRKQTLVVSFALKGLGFTIFPFATEFSHLVIGEIFLGIGVSLTSGTDISLLYDSLEASGSKKAPIKILGRYTSYMPMGEGIASILASLLLFFAVSMKTVVWTTALCSWIPFFISIGIVEPPRKKMEGSHRDNFRYIFGSLFKNSKLLNFIIINMVFSFVGTLIAVWLFQKYWEEIGISLSYFGGLWALNNFVVALAHRKAHKVEKWFGSVNMILLIGLLPVAGYLGISLVDHVLGYLVCLFFQISRGLGQIVYKDALNKRVQGDYRATANSIVQMGVRVIYVILGPLIGWGIDQFSLSKTTFVLSLIYAIVFVLFVVPLTRQRGEFQEI